MVIFLSIGPPNPKKVPTAQWGKKSLFVQKLRLCFLVSQSQSLSVLESHIQLRVSEFLDIKMSFVLVRT